MTSRRVAVVTRDRTTWHEGTYLDFDADPRVVEVRGDLDDLHFELALDASYDLIVDIAGRRGVRERFQMLLFHLSDGGRLVSELPPAGGQFDRARRRLLDFVAEIEMLRRSPDLAPPTVVRTDTRPWEVRDRHSFAASLEHIEVDGEFVVATARAGTLAKIPEARMNELLARRPEVGRVLKTVPSVTWTPRNTFHSTSPTESAPTVYEAPELSLREYRDVVCAPQQVALRPPSCFRTAFVTRRSRGCAPGRWSTTASMSSRIRH